VIGLFQRLAQKRLLTWEKDTADTAGSHIFDHVFYRKEDILSMSVAQMKKGR